jgi:outer membrane protein
MGSLAGHFSGTRRRFSSNRFYPAVVLASFLAGHTLGKEDAPPSPDRPWAPPGLSDYEHELARTNVIAGKNSGAIEIDPEKVYALPELIDIAERSNPDTRVAWERARAAARAVGLNESAYYPYLAASAGAEFQHELGVLTTVFPANVAAEDATLDVKWLLFDFGGRQAAVAEAREQLMAANVSFNATHQRIVFAVTKSFYDFNTARELVAVTQSSLAAAQTVNDATQARFDHGLATKPDLLQAEQETAQAAYDLDAAHGNFSDAQIALAESMGILPPAQLQVAEIPEKRFAENPEEPLDDLIQRALSQRPDLVAELAKLHASQDEVHKARSEYYPKVSLDANAGWSKLDINAYDSPYAGNSKPVYGIGMAIDLPLFDGFARRNKLRAAEAELRAAESELAGSRDAAVREVWKAYTDLKTALRKQESADKLLTAAQSAFDAALDSYRNGLETYVDVSNARRNLTTARGTMVDTRSAIFTSTAALALSVGDLARPASLSTVTHQP